MRWTKTIVSDAVKKMRLLAKFGEIKSYVYVTDQDNNLVGVINARDLIISQDNMKIEEVMIKKHSQWLVVNLFTVFLSACVIAIFESTIAKISALAVLIPVVIGHSTVAGSQTLSVIIKALVMGEIDFRNTKKIFLSEIYLGLVNGFICALLTYMIIFLWKTSHLLATAGFAAVILNTVLAGVSGALIPIIIKRLNYDPAHFWVVIVTTITDIAGLFFLLFIGKLIFG